MGAKSINMVTTEHQKKKILYIAKNIPIPNRKSNNIIVKIAQELSNKIDISFAYPSELVPWFFKKHSKYNIEYGLESFQNGRFKVNVFKYNRLPSKNHAFFFTNKLSKELKNIFSAEKFDLVHAHFLFPDGWFAYLLNQKYNSPYIITIRGSCMRTLMAISKNKYSSDHKKAELILRNAANILTLNRSQGAFLQKTYKVNSLLIPHGIEDSFFASDKVLINKELVVITAVGEAIKQKNIQWVIQAVMNYKGAKKIQLNVVGDGIYIDTLRELASANTNIIFHGKVKREKVKSILLNSDIFALPSVNETFGLVFVEAAANKTFVIGMKNEGVWGVFNEKEVFFCENYTHFEQGLYRGINDFNFRKEYAHSAYEKALSFKWDKITNRYMQTYLAGMNEHTKR